MANIHENFCGYIEIDKSYFVFSVSGHTVKLLPACSEPGQISKCISVLHLHEVRSPEYIFGIDEADYKIAFLLQNKFDQSFSAWRSSSFGAPIILKSSGNGSGFYQSLKGDWSKYDAINFSGGIINAVYNPKFAAIKHEPWGTDSIEKHKSANGAKSIEIKPFDEYTQYVDICIDGLKAKFKYSVSASEGADDLLTTSLGSLISFIRIEFEEPQEFSSISRFYYVIRSLLAIFSKQNNVNFEVSIYQKSADDKYFENAICKINDGFVDYCKRQFHNVVSLNAFHTHLSKLIEIICAGNADSLLALLPSSNKNRNTISITNVQDLCTALEVEYEFCGNKNPKDELIEKLKDALNSSIKTFSDEHPEIDVEKQTTIGNAFKNLDYNLKHKILYLYIEHKDAINGIIEKWSGPKITIDSIGAFVKLRNSKTHSGKTDWANNADLYVPLFALVYACLFKRAGVPENEIARALLQLF